MVLGIFLHIFDHRTNTALYAAPLLAIAADDRAECLEPIAMQQPDHQARSLRAFAPALVLLVISFLINYVDRGNLSIAAPLLSVELDLSPA